MVGKFGARHQHASSAVSSSPSEQPIVEQLLVSNWCYKISGFGAVKASSLLSSSIDTSDETIVNGGEVAAEVDAGAAVESCCCGCEMSMASSSSLVLLDWLLLDGIECESSRLGL